MAKGRNGNERKERKRKRIWDRIFGVAMLFIEEEEKKKLYRVLLLGSIFAGFFQGHIFKGF